MADTPSPESTNASPLQGDTHDRAVDLLMEDRAMVSQLLREHQILRETVEQSPVPCCVYDADDNPIVWNESHTTLNRDVKTLRLPSGQSTYERNLGDHGIFQLHEYPLSSGAIAATAIAVTDLRARESELAQARKSANDVKGAKTDFLANMSHEIRTPMNGIIGMVQMLNASNLDRKQKMYADVIARSGEALMTIIDDIIDLSKIEAEQVDLQYESFDLADSLEETATLFATAASDKNIDLIVRVDTSLPRRMIGDASRLRQIVSNLLSNAIKFTEAGHVFLDVDGTLSRRDDGREMARLVLSVQDTGSGMSEDLRTTVFDRFAQGDTLSTRKHKGAGLGLSIISGIVEAMEGTITVDSMPGMGTTFTITLDLPVDAARTMRRAPENIRGKRIVVVDVTAARRTILIEKLTAWGFEAAACADTREGKALLDKMSDLGTPADMVIVGDLNRLGEGGTAFLDLLRSNRTSQPRVVKLVSYDHVAEEADQNDPMVVATVPRPVRSSLMLTALEEGFAVPFDPRASNAAPEDDLDLEPNADDVIAIGEEEPTVSEPDPIASAPAVAAPEATAIVEADAAPEAEDVMQANTEASTATNTGGTGNQLDIVIAEDNEINQFLIDEILRSAGYSFRIVENGEQAIAAWREHQPRLILMDISMPVMGGIEAAQKIREQERGTRVPIIAVTAHALRGDRQQCIDAGMDDYLCKPISPTGMIEMIQRWIDTAKIAKSA